MQDFLPRNLSSPLKPMSLNSFIYLSPEQKTNA